MAETFLETRKNRLVVTALEVDDPVGMEPGLGQGWFEQIASIEAPENFARCPRRDAGDEESGCRAVYRPVTTAGDFVKRAELEPPSGQPPIDLRHAKRQHRGWPPVTTFNTLDLRAQRLNGGSWPQDRNPKPFDCGEFLLCSLPDRESTVMLRKDHAHSRDALS